FLAQASNRGGGEHDEARRPRDRQAGKLPQAEPGVAPVPLHAQAPTPSPPRASRIVTSTRGEEPVAQPEATPPVETPRPLPEGERNIDRELAMARLAAEIHRDQEAYAKRPNRKFVSASTREYEYASYLRAWVDRVERIGNLNYPDEARRRRLQGQVVISVAIRRDGSVERAEVVDSSGQPLLDQAALRIVTLAEPYPPLPETAEEVDILHVTRTWQFLPGGGMVDR
ncbi:MAG TPA: energy transducer TonB, partial [Xanthomonadaceae bacterium]|nr:energy transducer TonB [Xanthomonadaceae bacterium]